MHLHVDSDTASLVSPPSKNCVDGYYYPSKYYDSLPATPQPPLNAPINVEYNLLKNVVSYATEAEIAGIFYNYKTVIALRHMLEALDHQYHTIPIKTDNSTAVVFLTLT